MSLSNTGLPNYKDKLFPYTRHFSYWFYIDICYEINNSCITLKYLLPHRIEGTCNKWLVLVLFTPEKFARSPYCSQMSEVKYQYCGRQWNELCISFPTYLPAEHVYDCIWNRTAISSLYNRVYFYIFRFLMPLSFLVVLKIFTVTKHVSNRSCGPNFV
jgi:hypothetical protein